MIYTHVLNLGGGGVRSPVDSLPDLSAEGSSDLDMAVRARVLA
jgi:hypothetical protein